MIKALKCGFADKGVSVEMMLRLARLPAVIAALVALANAGKSFLPDLARNPRLVRHDAYKFAWNVCDGREQSTLLLAGKTLGFGKEKLWRRWPGTPVATG